VEREGRGRKGGRLKIKLNAGSSKPGEKKEENHSGIIKGGNGKESKNRTIPETVPYMMIHFFFFPS
jgi:hypothetical protein